MSLRAITLLRNRLKNNAALTDLFYRCYEWPVKHLAGYKGAKSAMDYPFVSYVPVRTTHSIYSESSRVISVVVGINEPGVDDDGMDGIARLAEFETLVMAALFPLHLDTGVTIGNEVRVIHDLGVRHPFYEIEFQVSIVETDLC